MTMEKVINITLSCRDANAHTDVLSALDAATNDLAQLIMTLNLEVAPGGTPNMTPLWSLFDDWGVDGDVEPRLSENPLRQTLRWGITSIASIRPYAQSL